MPTQLTITTRSLLGRWHALCARWSMRVVWPWHDLWGVLREGRSARRPKPKKAWLDIVPLEDRQMPAVVSITAGMPTLESASSVNIPVTLDQSSDSTVTVSWATQTAGATATPGQDYVSAS